MTAASLGGQFVLPHGSALVICGPLNFLELEIEQEECNCLKHACGIQVRGKEYPSETLIETGECASPWYVDPRKALRGASVLPPSPTA